MGVTPTVELPAVDITISYIHSAKIAYAPINDAYLTMVAPVDTGCELRKRHFEKRIDLDSALSKLLKETRTDAERTHMVVYEPNLHPGTRALHKSFGYTAPSAICLKNIVFEIHRVARGSYISLKSINFGSPVGKHLDCVRRIELRS